jgi:hypothetical protein
VANSKKSGRTRRKRSVTKRRSSTYRTTQVMVRVTASEKRLMIQGAQHEGDSLSTWLRRLAIQRVKQLKLTGR